MDENDKMELKEFFSTIREAFIISDEEKEKREESKREKYRMYSYDDIESVLTSNLSYEEKRRILSEEKQRANLLANQIEFSEKQFQNSAVFLNGMKKKLKEIIDDVKTDLFLTSISGATSGFAIDSLVKYLEENKLSDMPYNLVAAYSIGAVFLPILSLVYLYYTGRDLTNMNKYCKEIKSYERRLKNKRR